MHVNLKKWRSQNWVIVAIAVVFFLGVVSNQPVSSIAPTESVAQTVSPSSLDGKIRLSAPKPHSLPTFLAGIPNNQQAGDYLDQIKPTKIGYLVWSTFPVTVFIQPLPSANQTPPFEAQRAEIWFQAVEAATAEWSNYLPLQIVSEARGADITVWRSAPSLQLDPADGMTETTDRGRTGLPLGRVRSAETRFEVYVKSVSTQSGDSKPQLLLAHRFTIQLRPDQAKQYLQAAARHELGHALGIWGHSLSEADTMYFSQVRNPAPISERDLNTLVRIYQQPTQLGWPLLPPQQ